MRLQVMRSPLLPLSALLPVAQRWQRSRRLRLGDGVCGPGWQAHRDPACRRQPRLRGCAGCHRLGTRLRRAPVSFSCENARAAFWFPERQHWCCASATSDRHFRLGVLRAGLPLRRCWDRRFDLRGGAGQHFSAVTPEAAVRLGTSGSMASNSMPGLMGPAVFARHALRHRPCWRRLSAGTPVCRPPGAVKRGRPGVAPLTRTVRRTPDLASQAMKRTSGGLVRTRRRPAATCPFHLGQKGPLPSTVATSADIPRRCSHGGWLARRSAAPASISLDGHYGSAHCYKTPGTPPTRWANSDESAWISPAVMRLWNASYCGTGPGRGVMRASNRPRSVGRCHQ